MAALQMTSKWGYVVDYDKEIAADEAQVAHLSSPLAAAIAALMPAAVEAFPDYDSWCAYHLVTYKQDGLVERAALFGLTLDDVRAWAFFRDEPNIDSVLPGLEYQCGDRKRGEVIEARLGHIHMYSEQERVDLLRKAKTSLARHKRNKVKNA